MSNTDYKKKYLELKSVLMNVVDVSFKNGYQAGYKEAQADSAAQQLSAMQQNPMGMGGDPNAIGAEDQADQYMQSAAEAQGEGAGTELEAGIAELEAELSKSEIDKGIVLNHLNKMAFSVKKLKESKELKKSADMIKKIKTASKEIKGLSIGYKNNLNHVHKKTLNAQQAIVDNVLKKWETEEQKTSSSILDILSNENKTKTE